MNSPLVYPTIEPQVVITPVKPAELHRAWVFLERGLQVIRRKIDADWLPADVFGALRAEAAVACIVTRGPRALGFFIWHRQERPWSHHLDIFVWATWTLPLRERLPGDNITEAFARSIEYLHEIKRSVGAKRIIAISSRKGLIKRYGFRELFFTFEV